MSFLSLFSSRKPIRYFFDLDVTPNRQKILSFNKVLIAPRTYNEYINEWKKYGISKICTAVWSADSIAYRCNTCALNANMALCVECFDPDKHKGHDFYKFRTESAEGKCDCGDHDIMKAQGFCNKASSCVSQPPEDLIKAARLLLPEFLVKTYQMLFLEISNGSIDGVEYLMLEMLEDYVDISVHLRDIIVSAFIDKDLYCHNFDNDLSWYEESWFTDSEVVYTYGKSFRSELVVSSDKTQITRRDNILDAMYIWSIKSGFNFTITRLFIKLSADPTFKKHLANVFCRTYIAFMWYLQTRTRFVTIHCNRFSALSSQILTWTSQSKHLAKNLSLFRYLILYLAHTLLFYQNPLTQKYNFQKGDSNPSKFIPYPVVRDFQMIFGNQQFLLDLPENKLFSETWLVVVSNFFRIENNVRYIRRKNNLKPQLPFRGMNVDFEVCMSPVFSLIHALKEAKKPIVGTTLYRNLLAITIETIHANEFDAIDISLHLSMFRILFLFFATDMRKGILTAKNLKFDHGFLKNIVYYPVRLWIAVCEMLVVFWPFNGVSIQDVAKMYKIPNFSAATVDPDIFTMQLAASQLDPNFVAQLIFKAFHTLNDLVAPEGHYVYGHQPGYFIDQTLLYFAILIASRALAGENDDGSLRTEIICVLATRERTKPVLLKVLPDRGVNLQYKWLEDLDQILDDVAVLNERYFGVSNEPMAKDFSLKTKPFVEEYDPILAHMRSVHVGGLEESLANYYKSVEREKLNPTKVILWPPYRSPLKKHHPFLDGFTNFLHCSSFQAFLYTIFHKCMYGNMGDNSLQIAVHLLNMSFSFPFYSPNSNFPSFPICENCLIPYDVNFNVLNERGLFYLFAAYNKQTKLQDAPKKKLIGFDKRKTFADKHIEADTSSLPPLTTDNRSDETILSLLLKLFEKHTNKYYKPVHLRGPEAARYGSYKSSGVRIGGAEFFIGEVLDSLVEGDDEVLSYVEDYVRARSEVEEPAQEEDRKARLKRIAQEKKAKALAKMKKKQQEFKTTITDEQEEPETADEPEEVPLCSLCSKPLFQGDVEDLPTTVVLVTRTNLMGHRICKPHPFMSRLNINTFAHNFQAIKSLSKTIFPNSKRFPEWYDNLWVQSCGHEIHFTCYEKFIDDHMSHKQKLLPEQSRYKIFTSEFCCPYCRQLCNGVFPSISTPIFAGPLRKPRILDYESILSIISQPSQESPSLPIFDIISHLPDIVQKEKIQTSFFVDLLRNNIELLLMNKSLLAQEIQQDDYFPLKNLFKNIPIISVYNICRYALINRDRGKMMEVMKVLDPYDDEQSRYNLALADAKQLLVTTVIFMSQPTHELIKSVIHFFMNLYLLQLLSWMVVAADEGEIKDWIIEENLSDSQLDFIISLALNQFQEKKKKKQKEGETRETYTRTFKSRLTEFMKFCVVLYYSVLNFSDALKEDLESYELWDFYDLLLDGQLSGDDHISFVKCFGWDESMITIYSEKICRDIDFVTGINKHFYMVRDMMMVEWKPPKLISLPDSFDELLAIFLKRKLLSFRNVKATTEPRYFVCLVCSKYYPIGINEQNAIVKEVKHMERCGRGTCLSLEPRRNTVHIIWDKRASVWDSIYVDEQGESNIPLDKITKMYLCPRRLHMLENMWLFNSFDVFAKNWDIRIH